VLYAGAITGNSHGEGTMPGKELDKQAAIGVLNRILETELAGVVRYTHYSFMVFGYSRIPIVGWLRGQATESLRHAEEAGEIITQLGAHPSLKIGALLESHQHDIGDIMRESLEAERAALALYRELMELAEGRSVFLEEYARRLLASEEMHAADIEKMLRAPGKTAVSA
jgi:bacterioferritin